jgi:hypothetical protein
METLKALREALSGGIGGLIVALLALGSAGGVIALFVRFELEKRERRQDRRRELIRAVRADIEKEEFGNIPGFMYTANYYAIRPHLKPEVVRSLEQHVVDPKTGMAASGYDFLLKETTRLERK